MSNAMTDQKLEEYARMYPITTLDLHVQDMATELLALRADAETSQNHNAAVIDRIVEQLREAGYTGTLSEMVAEVIATARGDYNGL